MRVMKFGGSSLATPERVRLVGSLVLDAAREGGVAVVVSAVAGVTDLLERLTSGDPDGLEEVKHRHEGLWRSLAPASNGKMPVTAFDELLREIRALREGADLHGRWSPAARDHLLGTGERLSSRLLVSHLEALGALAVPVDAADTVRTDSTFGEACVDLPETFRLIRALFRRLPAGAIPVITGFTGADPRGRRTTLGRGSSDYTAAVVGAALEARVVEIWTDVDGICREDPALAPGAPALLHLGYGEARSMALAGAKVLHPRTLEPLERPGIPLRVRNTLRPWVRGTLVGREPQELRPVHLYVAGATGQVGSALLRLLASVGPSLREEEGVEILAAGAFSSRGQLWAREGMLPRAVLQSLANGCPPDWREIPGRLSREPHPHPVFVDCTASQEVADRYLEVLERGIPLVTPNKLMASGPLARYQAVRAAARRGRVPIRYETTVGAALPVLGTLRDLVRTGDRLRTVTGVLSGTLSFVFARLGEGVSFSGAVREARRLGLTEPNPREDLTGMDVARKLLILLRESGRDLEISDIPVESLVPDELGQEPDPEAFLAGLESVDSLWAARVDEARRRGEALAFVGYFGGSRPRVGVQAFPPSHPLHGLRPGENRVVIETDRYGALPLTVSGPGAGPDVTASGVLADILSVVREGAEGGRSLGFAVTVASPSQKASAGRWS